LKFLFKFGSLSIKDVYFFPEETGFWTARTPKWELQRMEKTLSQNLKAQKISEKNIGRQLLYFGSG